MKEITLGSLSREQLGLVGSLGAAWDTLGWAYFQLADWAQAEKYLNAAWVLSENATSADHLGQVYERQGRKADAIRAYQLALAAKSDLPETRARLEKLGGAANDRPTLRRGAPAKPHVFAADELNDLRTTRLPDMRLKPGSAEFFLLFTTAGVEDVEFISGDEQLKAAGPGAARGPLRHAFPGSRAGKNCPAGGAFLLRGDDSGVQDGAVSTGQYDCELRRLERPRVTPVRLSPYGLGRRDQSPTAAWGVRTAWRSRSCW